MISAVHGLQHTILPSLGSKKDRGEEKGGREGGEEPIIQKTPLTSFAERVAKKWRWSKGVESLNRKDRMAPTTPGEGGADGKPDAVGRCA